MGKTSKIGLKRYYFLQDLKKPKNDQKTNSIFIFGKQFQKCQMATI
jgi:hypothetical protein